MENCNSQDIILSISLEAKCKAGAAPSPFRFSTTKSLSYRVFRCPVEMSVCLETMQPFHTAIASALMTSMLLVSRTGYGWLPQDLELRILAEEMKRLNKDKLDFVRFTITSIKLFMKY
ncbi:hypothetical protein Hanom_Chr06g00522991 [Helianthus anomalus]